MSAPGAFEIRFKNVIHYCGFLIYFSENLFFVIGNHEKRGHLLGKGGIIKVLINERQSFIPPHPAQCPAPTDLFEVLVVDLVLLSKRLSDQVSRPDEV